MKIIHRLPFVKFDWHPAKEPYDIPGMRWTEKVSNQCPS